MYFPYLCLKPTEAHISPSETFPACGYLKPKRVPEGNWKLHSKKRCLGLGRRNGKKEGMGEGVGGGIPLAGHGKTHGNPLIFPKNNSSFHKFLFAIVAQKLPQFL